MPALAADMWVNSAPPVTPNVPLMLMTLPLLLLEHVRNGETRAQEHAAQMHLDHVVPGLHRHVGELEGIEHPGIVDEDVDLPNLLIAASIIRVTSVDLADIGAHRDGVAAVFFDRLDDRVGRLLILEIVDDDLSPFRGESFGNAAAEAAASPRHQRDLSRQFSGLLMLWLPLMRPRFSASALRSAPPTTIDGGQKSEHDCIEERRLFEIDKMTCTRHARKVRRPAA